MAAGAGGASCADARARRMGVARTAQLDGGRSRLAHTALHQGITIQGPRRFSSLRGRRMELCRRPVGVLRRRVVPFPRRRLPVQSERHRRVARGVADSLRGPGAALHTGGAHAGRRWGSRREGPTAQRTLSAGRCTAVRLIATARCSGAPSGHDAHTHSPGDLVRRQRQPAPMHALRHVRRVRLCSRGEERPRDRPDSTADAPGHDAQAEHGVRPSPPLWLAHRRRRVRGSHQR